MAVRKTKDFWILIDGESGDITSEPVFLNTPNDKYISVGGNSLTSVVIEIQDDNGNWNPVFDGTFTEPEARLFKGALRSYPMRAVMIGGNEVTVQVSK